MKRIIYLILSALLISACVDDMSIDSIIENLNTQGQCFSYSLQFEAPYPHYDGENATRATEAGEWEDGDVVYIYLDSPNNAYAQASYDKKNNNWNLICDKQLLEVTSARCYAWHGKYCSNIGYDIVATSAFYTTNGLYSIAGSMVKIQASLAPYGRRLRFRNLDAPIWGYGEDTSYMEVEIGRPNLRLIGEANALDKDNPFKTYSGNTPEFHFNDSKYTDYFVIDIDENVRQLLISYPFRNEQGYVHWHSFWRYFDDHTLSLGESGTFTVPSPNNLRGWAENY